MEELLRNLGLLDVEPGLNQAFKSKLEKLRTSLSWVQQVLPGAEERQLTEEKSVTLWLEKLKNVVYDAADVIDDFIFETLHRKVEIQSRPKDKVRKFFSLANPLVFRLNINQKLDAINESLDLIKSSREGRSDFQVPASVDTSSVLRDSLNRGTSFFPDDPKLVKGREDDVSRVISLLIRSSNRKVTLPVVPIVGKRGLGKTILAKLVCDKAVKERKLFDLTIWVFANSVSLYPEGILRKMLLTLAKDMEEVNGKDEVLQRLKRELRGKKFLLVLDNVGTCDQADWEALRNYLLEISGYYGSAVVATTLYMEMASRMESSPRCSHKLQELSNDECWSIIRETVSGNGGSPVPLDLEATGEEIAEKCIGVPFAARVLGGMMRITLGKEWLSIKNDLATFGPWMPLLLKHSYRLFPSDSVKRCFAYCSIFRKDFIIEKEQLIQLWMAEGFLGTSGERMEDVGNKCFNYLVEISFLEVMERDECENIVSVKMHDLVHNLAVSISEHETLELKPWPEEGDLPHPRFLYINCDRERALEFSKLGAQKLRSLFSLVDVIGDSSNFECLRVLKLDGADIKELRGSVGKLRHLRYLDVSRTCIVALPDSISNLCHLQTLRFIECRLLQTLPSKMRDLISLKYIYFTYHHQMPAEVGCLTSLEKLPLFVVDPDRGNKIQALESLELDGKLSIFNLERVRDKREAEKASLDEKDGIYKLELVWSSDRESWNNDEDVLEGLQPHQNIKSLKIENYGGEKFPSWLLMKVPSPGDSVPLKNLVNLKLIHCKRSEELPMLGRLHHLKTLVIIGMNNVRCIGIGFYINGAESGTEMTPLFPALKKFSLQHMDNLAEWVLPAAVGGSSTIAFRYLEELSVMHCPQLTTIPVSHLPSLVKLEVHFCSELRHLSTSDCTSLEDLSIVVCPNLETLGLGTLPPLKRLRIQRCHKLTYLETHDWMSLELLAIQWCAKLASILEDSSRLHSLVRLEITKCPSLVCFPEDRLHNLTQLKQLTIGPFSEELGTFPGLYSIRFLASLEELVIYGWDKLESLPDELCHLTALKSLHLRRFNKVKALPEWLGTLSCLQQLGIWRCKNLSHLPKAMHHLSELKKLEIIDCRLLKENCAEDGGSEWSKISHIKEIYMI